MLGVRLKEDTAVADKREANWGQALNSAYTRLTLPILKNQVNESNKPIQDNTGFGSAGKRHRYWARFSDFVWRKEQ